MESWSQKYCPQDAEGLRGREKALTQLIQTFTQNPCSTVLISGPGGVGKTTLATVVLRNIMGYKLEKYDSITHKNDRLLEKLINVNHNNLLERLKNHKPDSAVRTALLIDNLDTISLSSEKSIIDTIITTNIKSKLFPLVLTVNDNSTKVVEEIKGITTTVRLESLTEAEMKSIIADVQRMESMQFGSPDIADNMIKFAKGDLRLIFNLLQDISLCFPSREITLELYESFIQNNTRAKNLDLHLFDSFRMLIQSRGNIPKTLSIYNNDKVLLPLILQENFYKDLRARILTPSQQTLAAKVVSEFISQGDIIETYIYTDQNWHLQELHCFTSCTFPVHFLNHLAPYKNSVENPDYQVNFSTELNKTSLKNINRKNISLLCTSSKIPPQDVQRVSSLMNELVRAEKLDTVRQIAEQYSEEPLRFVETIIKINKCNPSVAFLGSKAKKFIGALTQTPTSKSTSTQGKKAS